MGADGAAACAVMADTAAQASSAFNPDVAKAPPITVSRLPAGEAMPGRVSIISTWAALQGVRLPFPTRHPPMRSPVSACAVEAASPCEGQRLRIATVAWHACWVKADRGNARPLVDESEDDVIYLEIGDRSPGDQRSYPHDDLVAALIDSAWRYSRKDRAPY